MPSQEEKYKTHVEDYFREIAPWRGACKKRTLSYYGAFRSDGVLQIFCARLFLHVENELPLKDLVFGRYGAGRLQLSESDDVDDIVKTLFAGRTARVGTRDFALPFDDSSGLHVPPPNFYHQEGATVGRRVFLLEAVAGSVPHFEPRPQIDWLLRAAVEPYDNLGELLGELGLPGVLSRCSLDVVAPTPVEVWAGSRISDTEATLGLWLPRPLLPADAALQYRVVSKGQTSARGILRAELIRWDNGADVQVGKAVLQVPPGAVVQCFAGYCGQALHSYWVADPKHFPNPRLSAFETIDPKLNMLRTYLLPPSAAKGSANINFEMAVSWLAWAYGLAPASMGLADQGREGPDLYAVAPSGGFVVIECTLGLLKAENKLANLARRAAALRDKLTAIGLPKIPVLPLIITALPREHVRAEMEAADAAGVLVITREGLEAALTEAMAFPDGDSLFQRGVQALTAIKDRLRKSDDLAAGPSGSGTRR